MIHEYQRHGVWKQILSCQAMNKLHGVACHCVCCRLEVQNCTNLEHVSLLYTKIVTIINFSWKRIVSFFCHNNRNVCLAINTHKTMTWYSRQRFFIHYFPSHKTTGIQDQFPDVTRKSLVFRSVKNTYGFRPVSQSTGVGVYSQGAKRRKRAADHSL